MFDFLSQYQLRRLDPIEGTKPLDFGGRGINGSLTRDGRLVAINVYHPGHGYVSLSSVPPFPDDQRYDPQAVRRYRKAIAKNEGFGLHFFSPIVQREAWLVEDALPYLRLTLENGVVAETVIYVAQAPSPAGVVQCWQFSEYGEWAAFTGKVWLQHCAYTQLTEGGVVNMPSVETKIFYQRKAGLIGLENQALDYRVYVNGYGCEERDDGSVEFLESGMHFPDAGKNWVSTPEHTDRSISFNMSGDPHHPFAPEPELLVKNYAASWEGIPDDPILRRGLTYGLNCCVPISENATCILTDHMLLPLSWNRDAYYVAIPLMKWHAAPQVENHLRWMFDVAERIDGLWGRSYLANGKIKDRGYQLDQQLFPILELAEYAEYTGKTDLLTHYTDQINAIFERLTATKHPEHWLFPTDETPGDDPIPFPYPLSSHILMWYVCQKLAGVESPHQFAELAEHLRASVDNHFIGTFDGKSIYAYATDGEGNHHFYHDANDMPLALAPAWGFISADNPVWRATMNFAFSEANAGFFDGGLGSVHTPAAWSLGDIQDIIIARAMDDSEREAKARTRLEKAAQWDGALPEAYDSESGEVISRYWFAWANAMLAYIGSES